MLSNILEHTLSVRWGYIHSCILAVCSRTRLGRADRKKTMSHFFNNVYDAALDCHWPCSPAQLPKSYISHREGIIEDSESSVCLFPGCPELTIFQSVSPQ